ncbi:MAG: hypothetical protein M1378_11940, partial [Bacteroidetes bacterium]|nr:hypothetical protein [Bacteroidota bacterium]
MTNKFMYLTIETQPDDYGRQRFLLQWRSDSIGYYRNESGLAAQYFYANLKEHTKSLRRRGYKIIKIQTGELEMDNQMLSTPKTNYEEEKARKAKVIADARKKFADVATQFSLFTDKTASFFRDENVPEWYENVGTLRFKDSVSLRVRADFYRSSRPFGERIRVRAEYTSTYLPYDFLKDKTTEITMALSRSTEALVKDIARRLLPDAIAIHEAGVTGEKAHNEYEAKLNAFVKEVIAATGEGERDNRHGKGVEQGQYDARHDVAGWVNGYYIHLRTSHENR